MLRIDNLKLPVGAKEDKLRAACAHALRVSEEALVSVKLLRRSIDAREGVKLVCSCAVEVKNESGVLRRCKNKNVQPYAPKKYTPPAPISAPEVSPVVIGAGPSGLFCALLLARCGARPILLERGRAVEQRKRDVEHFWRTGELDLTSNVQFGEGGAGAFSDGKLNTGTKDLRHGYILEEFVRFGASEDILVDAKPHVGTDKLYVVLQNLRREIIDRGGEVRFSNKLTGLVIDKNRLAGIEVSSPDGAYTLDYDSVILAIGHSARDTFEMLDKTGVPMQPKAFSMGARIEHKQAEVLDLSDKIWGYAELSYEETKSAAALIAALKQEGFTIEEGIADIPTAFTATYQCGSGKPVVGFLAAGRRVSTATRSDMLMASLMSWVTSRAVFPSCRMIR